ncbi:aminoglycoside phosphotransferase [Aliiroseovarius zhejiangensis]|uniref:Aminoglycoside phosphotransferase n=1 Tax=Aliiroseovarius zhejiangensis TaxID=1632025 RepID=A0ABQ3J395_9RHOB|nr:phosphotransferase [Aliiroseovarius zhejiangensis]GHF02264.1 aminoglycoside phosphotransferase [Aliiroseovarius zhejiangensis]
MTKRADQISRFLASAGWQSATMSPITGDASARVYQRLFHPKTQQTAILMDASPDRAGSSAPFLAVAEYLKQAGLSAPVVFAHDIATGFLLLEDLGDDLFANVITNDPSQERPLYEAAVHVICHLHDHPNPELPPLGPAQMAQATDLAFLHYRKTPRAQLSADAAEAMDVLRDMLARLDDFNKVSLRDYHAENLIWLPQRSGIARVGLLDFQDAVLTHPAYDLMSLIRDARRDVSPAIADHLITMFCQINGHDETRFRAEAALISAQRNLRILGIFARLSRVMGKPQYVDLIPRVWANLQTDLSHPSLSRLSAALGPLLPPPTEDFLHHLRTPCQTPS